MGLARGQSFCTRPSNWSYTQNRHKQIFLGPRNFCILQIFKPPFQRLGSYEFRQSLLSRNFCWVPDLGSTPKWLPPSSLWMSWRTLSARRGSCPIGRPFHTYLWLTSSCPRKNPRSSRSSFLRCPTSACPSTPVGTTRNTLRTCLQLLEERYQRALPRDLTSLIITPLKIPPLISFGRRCIAMMILF